VALALAGCAGLGGERGEPNVYRIAPAADAALGARIEALPRPLAVIVEARAPVLAGDRLVVVQGAHRITHVRGARWAAPLPQLLQASLARLLDTTGSPEPESGPHGLRLTLDAFQAELPGGAAPGRAQVRVALAMVLTGGDGERLGAARLQRCRPLAERRQTAIVAALEAAFSDTLTRGLGALLAEAPAAPGDDGCGGEPRRGPTSLPGRDAQPG